MFTGKRFVWLLVLVLAIALVLPACTPAGDDEGDAEGEIFRMGYATVGPMDHQYTIAASLFKEIVEEKSDGRIQVTLYPDAQLGGEREMAEAVRMGTVEMSTVTSDGTLPAWVPEIQIFSIPFLFADRDHAYTVMDGEIGEELAALFEEQGFLHLGFVELGWRHFTNNVRPINTPADMEGLSIRVQEAPVWFALIEAVGGTPTPIAFDELYTALQTGAVDGQENPPATIRNMAFYEVQDYLALSGHTYAPGSVIVNPDFFNSLPEDLQAIFLEAVEEMIVQQREIIAAQEAEDLEFLRTEGGMEITEPDRELFQEATLDVPEVVSDMVPLELVERVRELGQ